MIVAVVYEVLVQLYETQLEVNMKLKEKVPVLVLLGVWMKMIKDIWGDEDWEKDTSKMNLWTIDLGNRCTVWAVTGNGQIMDVDERKDDTCVCGGKDEAVYDEKGNKDEDGYDTGWSEDMINGTRRLLLDGDGSAVFNILVQRVLLMIIKLI